MPTVQHHLERASNYIQIAADAGVATGAMALSWWRKDIHELSGLAGDLTLIAAFVLVVLRCLHLIYNWKAKEKPGGDD